MKISWNVFNRIVTWSANCVMVSSYGTNQAATFTVTDTKLFVPVVTLPTKDNVKLRQKLKSGSKRTYN